MTWWQRLVRRGQMEEQLDKELLFHLEQHTADLIARGVAPEEARRKARLAMGGPAQVKEGCRDARGTRWLEDVWQDFRYALRTWRQKPGFALVGLTTLALGTGATTVMFTLIRGVLLKPLPYVEPQRLLSLQEQTDWSTQFGNLWAFTYPNYRDCKLQSRSLDLAAWRPNGGTVVGNGYAEYVDGFEISANLLPLLGVAPSQGRAFLEEEDRLGAAPVILISGGLWQRRYGGSPAAIGMPLVFNGTSYTIAGIAPDGLRLGGDEADVFTLLGQDPSPRMQNRAAHGLRVWARLHAGATLAAAQAELGLIGRALAEQYPKSNKGRSFLAEPLRANVSDVRATLWLLLGAVSLVLLIACANIAGLLLSRAASREHELAMRVALGASRGRLIRQCLTESAVLGLSGGVLGVILAAIGIRPFVVFWPGSLPRSEEVRVDWQVLLFALAVSLVCGLLFGLAPALRVPTRALEHAVRGGSRTVAGRSSLLQGGFVASEIALAVVLLVCAGMLGRTMLHLSSLDPGVNIQNVLTARMALSPATLANPGRTRAAWQDVLDRARRVPGVQAVAMVDTVPLRDGNNTIGYSTSAAALPENQQPLVMANGVTPDYLKVMGITLRRGRFFDDRDRMDGESVAVIDTVMAQEAFGGQDPLGKHLWIGIGADPIRVVGVVGHVRYWGPAGDDKGRVRAQLYYPFAQVPDNLVRRWSELMSIAIRTGSAPLNAIESLRREVRGAGGDQVLYEVRTMEQLSAAKLARQRFLLLLFGIFAGLALLLACVGIYGVLAYLTGQRVPEIGIRIALGATGPDVMRMVLRQSLGMIASGTALGLAAALAAARLLERLVEGMRPMEPATVAIVLAVLVAAALAASFVPARRASRVDPMTALRADR